METNRLDVYYNDLKVGALEYRDRRIFFSYDKEWLANGFSISPRSLPLLEGEFTAKSPYFKGLFAVFADSLPNGWGMHLSEAYFKVRHQRDYFKMSSLERLTYLGQDRLGALRYIPSDVPLDRGPSLSMDAVAKSIDGFLDHGDLSNIDQLYAHGACTGGARPKIHAIIDGEEWIVKFSSHHDKATSGRMEYEYCLAAKEAGIEMSECMLLPSSICDGYFACKRFDRKNGRAVHVLSLAGLLETPHNLPILDYVAYLQATAFITNSEAEVYKAFRRACFNVFAKNYDDHSKNFAFHYDEIKGGYMLSPAYDLTWCPYGMEHQMTCCGDGVPNEDSLVALASKLSLDVVKAHAIIDEIKTVVESRLGEWIHR